jgi:hypothetical protein
LVGCDDIELIQAYETMNYLYTNDSKSRKLNSYVFEKLNSETAFLKNTSKEQSEILEIYLSNLDEVKHSYDRAIWFATYVMLPKLKKYLKGLQFLCFRKRSIKSSREKINNKLAEYNDIIPKKDLMEKKKLSGIQKSLKKDT